MERIEIKLTEAEGEVVRHRLGDPDAIADALTDCDEGDTPPVSEPYDEIVEAAAEMDCEIRAAGAVVIDRPLKLEILRDALDGSTFFANNGDWSTLEKRRWLAVATRLEAKFKDATGDDIEIPRE